MNKTKMICTIGPSTNNRTMIKKMIEAGMDVARINLSHADYDFAEQTIKTIRELSAELNTSVGILIDIKGPKMRIVNCKYDNIQLEKGNIITLTSKCSPDDDNKFLVSYPNLAHDVKKNDRILLCDGVVELQVIDEKDDDVICKVVTGGTIRHNANVNIPGVDLMVDFLSVADKNDIVFASKMDADFISLSFVRNANDVLDVNDMLIGLKNEHIQIIAKIENNSAIEDIDNIIKVSNGIMVARGDLGVEIDLEKVPSVQKMIVKKCFETNKICIVATQMLSSMQNNPKPTRAEVSDVANAVIDGVDAVMLSDETAIGKYPIETVEMMNKIIENIEDHLDYDHILSEKILNDKEDITTVIAHNVVYSSNRLKTDAIVVSTMTGYTARMVSSFRPYSIIIASTPNEAVARSLTLNWGIVPTVTKMFNSTDEIVKNAIKTAKEKMKLSENARIIITGAFPMTKDHNTNFMKIEEIKKS